MNRPKKDHAGLEELQWSFRLECIVVGDIINWAVWITVAVHEGLLAAIEIIYDNRKDDKNGYGDAKLFDWEKEHQVCWGM